MNENFTPSQLDKRDINRLRSYRELLDFYHGQHWEGYPRLGETRLTFNYAKVIIDKITSYLMSGITFAVDPLADSAEARASAQRAEQALYRVYEANSLEQLDFETEIDCAILGDGCFKVIWDAKTKGVKVTAPDIQGIYVWWLGDDTSRVWRVASKYNLTAEETAFRYQVKPKGKTATIVELWTAQDFELWLDNALVERKPNPYRFIPFVIYPNLREPKKFWGISDLTQLMLPQRELNRAMSQLSKILELSGNPIAVLENVEESEDIAVRPGAVWNLPEDARAYLLDLLQGGGVSLHIEYVNLLYRILHDVSESPRSAFGGTERSLSGVAACYGGDFNLFITGQDSEGNFRLWSLIYGDGGELSPGTWSELKQFAQAPADGDFEYRQAFMAKPDVYRCFFVEKFTGTEAYMRPFWSHSVPDTGFSDNLWHEPVPFNLNSEYGLAIAHHGSYCWLSRPDGVWRASLTEESLDLTADILSIRQELTNDKGRLTVELDNTSGRYATPGEGELSVLDIGSQLDVSPGYTTPQGNEVSPGLAFQITAYEHTSSAGKASLILYAQDGWNLTRNWCARHQFRWNQTASEMNVREILAFVLGRCGLRLEVKSQSQVLDSYYPDFSIHPHSQGDAVIRRLLSFVPDVIFIEGGKVYVENPTASDTSSYSYGLGHPMLEGRYRKEAWDTNRIQVEGYDPVGEESVIVDSFSWNEIDRLYDRLEPLEDRNIASVSQAEQRGEAYLRSAEIEATSGAIRIPVNCGQQLYDVIDITDPRAGLNSTKKRVVGITLSYSPLRREYEERLLLGAV